MNRVAPIALAPSYVSWDYHYRQAIPLVEQAQQLINHPTSPADLVLAETVLTKAKTHVEALPVTFLSDSPSSIYRYWYGSNYDQFQELRKSSGQMTARLFQERQSQALLTEAEQALATAKTQYINAQSHPEKLAALAAWASALNEFEQISANTLAGQTARTKLKLHENEYLSIRQ